MRLEALAARVTDRVQPYPLTQGPQIDPGPLFRAWAADRLAGAPPAVMAAARTRARSMANLVLMGVQRPRIAYSPLRAKLEQWRLRAPTL